MPTCSVDGCDNALTPRSARGMCSKHYRRWQRHGDPTIMLNGRGSPLVDRFRQRYVVADNGCWHWTGPITSAGYGTFSIASKTTVHVHRWSYEHFIGSIPGDHEIDHTCHNRDTTCAGGPTCLHRRCVNPKHLEPVSHRTNTLRSSRTIAGRYAARTTCPEGHPFDTVCAKGHRLCSTCRNAKQNAKRREKRREKRRLAATPPPRP